MVGFLTTGTEERMCAHPNVQHSKGGGLLLSGGSPCTVAFKGWRLVTVSVGSPCTVEFKGWRLVTMSGGSLCVLQHSKGGGLLLCVWAVRVL